MREGHLREAQQQIGAFPNGLGESNISSQHERDTMRLVHRQPLEPLRKLQRIHRPPSLIEDDDVPRLGNCFHQARRLGAHDRPTLHSLSTSLAEHLPYLNRVEVLDSIEITVDDRNKLSVRSRTGPKEPKFHLSCRNMRR